VGHALTAVRTAVGRRTAVDTRDTRDEDSETDALTAAGIRSARSRPGRQREAVAVHPGGRPPSRPGAHR